MFNLCMKRDLSLANGAPVSTRIFRCQPQRGFPANPRDAAKTLISSPAIFVYLFADLPALTADDRLANVTERDTFVSKFLFSRLSLNGNCVCFRDARQNCSFRFNNKPPEGDVRISWGRQGLAELRHFSFARNSKHNLSWKLARYILVEMNLDQAVSPVAGGVMEIHKKKAASVFVFLTKRFSQCSRLQPLGQVLGVDGILEWDPSPLVWCDSHKFQVCANIFILPKPAKPCHKAHAPIPFMHKLSPVQFKPFSSTLKWNRNQKEHFWTSWVLCKLMKNSEVDKSTIRQD